MKKISILSIAFIALSFASCKKERTCTCTTTDNDAGSVASTKTIVYKKITKSNAKAACISIEIKPDGDLTSTGQPLVESRKYSLK